MGCDIHMFVERRKRTGEWAEVGKVFKNPYYNPEKESTKDSDGYEWNPSFIRSPYRNRNYNLFAILADVRNGRGFAGVKTGEGFNSIDDPRGLPDNVSKRIKNESDKWGEYGHSHSWLLLSELLNYDWGQITMLSGYVSLEEYKRLRKEGGFPKSWCGDVYSPNLVKLDEKEADLLLDNPKLINVFTNTEEKNYQVLYSWSVLYKDCVSDFLTETIPQLEILSRSTFKDDVRIVFWFDN